MPETGNNGGTVSVQASPDGSSSLFTHKCTLVPKPFFNEASASLLLSEVVTLDEADIVGYIDVPEYDAVLVFAGVRESSALPELYYMLKMMYSLEEYNKIVASFSGERLYLTVAQGKSLLICNSFAASDFTTAEYFLFLVMKKFQLNPEVSSIYFRTPLTPEQELSLYTYFKSVEQTSN